MDFYKCYPNGIKYSDFTDLTSMDKFCPVCNGSPELLEGEFYISRGYMVSQIGDDFKRFDWKTCKNCGATTKEYDEAIKRMKDHYEKNNKGENK